MGLDANFPAVTMNDPNGHVTVYNQDHLPIGQLGPTPFESPSVNVTCRRKAWEDAYWYRLLNPDGWDFPATAAYVSADETHELNPGQPYPIPECKNLGCRRKAGQAVAAGVLAAGAITAVRSWRRRADATGTT
ncbi:hypothetical protein ACGFIF_19920 [Kribbella sp. NPDC049174]|uniref:hypothetical protein n=1 Tax=Kribbella sp. NPDC049174 TaxID=3364112 RepID=UPI003712F1E1